ncbi:MAG: COG4315 family predicted lipoprotein [Sciscionella sp.]
MTVAGTGKLGPILVDESGRTVYLFEKDDGNKSTCYAECASAWPPVTGGAKPKAGGQARGSLLGTTTRHDGTMQVTYHNHPLYYYAPDDHQQGSTKGQDITQFGASWYALSPKGMKVENNQGGGS